MITHVEFTVRGTPMQKGSTTRMPNGATLAAGTAASRQRMTDWRHAVRTEARHAMGDTPPFVEPIRLFAEFSMMPPRTTIKKAQRGWLPHTKRPDIDKLFRMLADCLTGIVWVDDSQVCVSAINKVYAWDGKPGVHVDASVITDESAQALAVMTGAIRGMLIDPPIDGAHE